MAAIWKGALSFGLVNIPVAVQSAARSANRLSFRQLHAKDLTPIKMERVNRQTGEPVAWEEIVKGYEIEKGRYVVMTPEDFQSAGLPSSKTIDILSFAPAGDVDVRFFEHPYYLVPAAGGEKAYALLREAMKRTGTVGIGRFTMRANAQHLVAVMAIEEALVLELLRFADEVVPLEEYSFPAGKEVRPQELTMAERLIENLTEQFEPSAHADEYRANLERIIAAKAKGETVTFAEPSEPEPTPVIDLLARLKESLEQGGAGGRGGKRAAGGSSASGSSAGGSRSKGATTKRAPRRERATAAGEPATRATTGGTRAAKSAAKSDGKGESKRRRSA